MSTESPGKHINESKAGDPNYRAFVGPPDRYDLISTLQFNLLTGFLGMRARHVLLDVGCGSLRSGRLFIPYLDKGHYYGIEPESWLVQEGIANECGQDLVELKSPSFVHRTDFDASSFGVPFDFAIAHSIFSHTSPTLTVDGLRKVGSLLRNENASYVATFALGPRDYEGADAWVYPRKTTYRPETILHFAREAGLEGVETEYRHPTQRWFLFGLPGALPRLRDRKAVIDACAQHMGTSPRLQWRERIKDRVRRLAGR